MWTQDSSRLALMIWFLAFRETNSHGLQPISDGLQPRSDLVPRCLRKLNSDGNKTPLPQNGHSHSHQLATGCRCLQPLMSPDWPTCCPGSCQQSVFRSCGNHGDNFCRLSRIFVSTWLLVTTSKALVTTSDALVPNSFLLLQTMEIISVDSVGFLFLNGFLLLLVRHLLLLAMHLFLIASCYYKPWREFLSTQSDFCGRKSL